MAGKCGAACALALGCGTWSDGAAQLETSLRTASVELDGGSSSGARPDAESKDWQRLLGSSGESLSSRGVAVDAAGHVLVTGYTLKSLESSEQSRSDAFVAAYSGAGGLLWTAELATAASDAAAGVSLDAEGNALIAGDTSGALEGTAYGFGDAYAAKYSPGGELVWVRQIGTAAPDEAASVRADASGNVFVAGWTRGVLEGARAGNDFDGWIAKYSPAGDVLWMRQLGSSVGYDDAIASVSTDAEGNALIAGRSFGALEGANDGSSDAFVAKLSGAGELLWMQQVGGAGYDAAESVQADADGNVFIAGQLGGSFAGGPGVVIPGQPFVAKYSPAGEQLWLSALEQGAMGSVSSLAIDGADAVIAGYTSADWGAPNQGSFDSFLARVSADGELLDVLQTGAPQLDKATSVSVDAAGDVFWSRDVWNAGDDGSDQAFLARQTLD
jgi:hypothetical protein